jgi:hypothetical protein
MVYVIGQQGTAPLPRYPYVSREFDASSFQLQVPNPTPTVFRGSGLPPLCGHLLFLGTISHLLCPEGLVCPTMNSVFLMHVIRIRRFITVRNFHLITTLTTDEIPNTIQTRNVCKTSTNPSSKIEKGHILLVLSDK